MTVRVTTEPAVEPVTLAEFKDWARIDEATADDAVCTLLIAAMRGYAENLTGRAFVQRSLQLVLEGWPCSGEIVLPCPPLVSVASVKYYDEDGVDQTLAADQYLVHDWREPALVVPAYGVTWPAVRSRLDTVRVNYVAGYPTPGSPTDYRERIPAALKLWMSARAATFFEYREQIQNANLGEIPRAFVDGLLDELVLGERLA